jgi:hypothetical protein
MFGYVEEARAKSMAQEVRVGLVAAQWVVSEYAMTARGITTRQAAEFARDAINTGGTLSGVTVPSEITNPGDAAERLWLSFRTKIDGVTEPWHGMLPNSPARTGFARVVLATDIDPDDGVEAQVVGITYITEEFILTVENGTVVTQKHDPSTVVTSGGGTPPCDCLFEGNWEDLVPAKCGIPGEEKDVCARTGCDLYITQVTAALSHSYPAWSPPAINNNFIDGKQFRECIHDGCTEKDDRVVFELTWRANFARENDQEIRVFPRWTNRTGSNLPTGVQEQMFIVVHLTNANIPNITGLNDGGSFNAGSSRISSCGRFAALRPNHGGGVNNNANSQDYVARLRSNSTWNNPTVNEVGSANVWGDARNSHISIVGVMWRSTTPSAADVASFGASTLCDCEAGAEATCTTAQNCTLCSRVMVAALGHNVPTTSQVSPAGCLVAEVREGECTRCSTVVQVPGAAALGHQRPTGGTWSGAGNSRTATCARSGCSQTLTCANTETGTLPTRTQFRHVGNPCAHCLFAMPEFSGTQVARGNDWGRVAYSFSVNNTGSAITAGTGWVAVITGVTGGAISGEPGNVPHGNGVNWGGGGGVTTGTNISNSYVNWSMSGTTLTITGITAALPSGTTTFRLLF